MPGIGIGIGIGMGMMRSVQMAAQQMIKRADYGAGAAVAFSLVYVSQSYSGDVLLTRRSSDNAQLGVTPSQITDGTLVNFCNTEVNKYTSDFSVSEDLSEVAGTGAANQSIGGVNEAYSLTLSGGGVTHQAIKSGFQNQNFRVEFDYYIPSSNSLLDGIELAMGGTTSEVFSVLDTWTSASKETTAVISDGNVRFRSYDTSGGTSVVNADGDVFYLKNIVVTQLTSDGHVVTWYGQRGGINASQGTATAQPRIVIAGALVTENGKPAIDFDGTSDFLAYAGDLAISQPFTSFVTFHMEGEGFVFDNTLRAILGDFPGGAEDYGIFAGSWVDTGNVLGSQILASSLFNGASSENYVNGAVWLNGNAGTNGISTNLTIGARVTGISTWFNGKIQEVIIYPADMSADRAEIEEQTMQHYGI